MSWFKKHPSFLLILCLIFTLTACGFKPLYKTEETQSLSGTPLLSTIFITPIADKEGQMLRNLLIDRFYQNGTPQNRRYELVITPLKADYTDLGIRRDATKTRQQLRLSTTATLHDRTQDRVLFTRKLRTVNGFNVLDSQFSNIISREDALARSLQDLANQITLQTQIFLKQDPKIFTAPSAAAPSPVIALSPVVTASPNTLSSSSTAPTLTAPLDTTTSSPPSLPAPMVTNAVTPVGTHASPTPAPPQAPSPYHTLPVILSAPNAKLSPPSSSSPPSSPSTALKGAAPSP